MSESDPKGKTKTIRLYGYVHDELKAMKREGESFNDTLERILPDEMEVIEYPKKDEVGVAVTESINEKLVEAAGQNVSVSDVVEKHIENYRENNT